MNKFNTTWGNRHYMPKTLIHYLKKNKMEEPQRIAEEFHKTHVKYCQDIYRERCKEHAQSKKAMEIKKINKLKTTSDEQRTKDNTSTNKST